MYIKKFLLTLNLQTFAADQGGGGSGESDNTKTDEKTDDESTKTDEKTDDEKQEEKTVPFTRFSEINKKYKEISAELDKLEKEREKDTKQKEKAAREAKEKAGEYETLYSETKTKYDTLEADVTSKTTRIEALESTIQELLDEHLKDVEKEHLDLIPDNLSVEDKLSWVIKAKARGMLGKSEINTPIGGAANPKTPVQKIDNMSPSDLLRAAFSRK